MAVMASTGKTFFGWQVTWAAFVVAVFGWGVGFYGPPVFLHVIVETRGWSVGLVSSAVTCHFLLSALTIANLPKAYRRFGLSATTKVCGLSVLIGITGWAWAEQPWQLFLATIFSGFGWAGTGALAINMMVSPWFDRRRPAALSLAYNGASAGGVLFSPLWVALIALSGFQAAVLIVGLTMFAVLWFLSERFFSVTPKDLGQRPDGGAERPGSAARERASPPARSGRVLWTSRAFITLTGGFAIGLFVQVGIIAHLISLLVPALGAQGAGLAAGLATLCAIAGRTLVGWFLPADADRRAVAAATYGVQACGCLAFVLAEGHSVPFLMGGVVLFGLGIGNVTSLPPLIAQVEFAKVDVPRAIALSTAITQASFAFAPAAFGLIRVWSAADTELAGSGAPLFFVAAAVLQVLAAGVYLLGRSYRRSTS